MFILKLAGKILLLPVWLILFVIGLAVKMTVQTYAVVRGILTLLLLMLLPRGSIDFTGFSMKGNKSNKKIEK